MKNCIHFTILCLVIILITGCGQQSENNTETEEHADSFQKLIAETDTTENTVDNEISFEDAVQLNQDGLNTMSEVAQTYVEDNDLPSDYFQVKSVITDGFNPTNEELEQTLNENQQFIGESFKNEELSYYISQYTQYAVIMYCISNNINAQFNYIEDSIQTSDISSNVIELNVEAQGIVLKITYDMSTDNVKYEQL